MFTYFWDIETSKIICDNGEVMQVTYLSNILVMNYLDGEIVKSTFKRTIEETIEYFKTIKEEVIVWSHNLDYELTFLLRELEDTTGEVKYNKNGVVEGIYNENVQNIILRDKHSPLSIKLDILPNITFRDTYAIFNKSVARLGEEIGLPKLDYDYKITRLPWDNLEELDYTYNERDNVIVAKSLYKYMQENKLEFEEIPLTFTSFVKRKRKEFIVENYGKKAINKFYFDRNEQFQDFNYFELILKTYQGGLTASNINETGKLIDKGIYSIDKKSSYPYQMCSKFFPFYSYKTTENYTGELANSFYKIGNFKGFFGLFRFKNIRVKNRNYLLPISSSQLSKGFVSSDRVHFNGKLLSASEIIIPANDVDIDTINLVYKYDEIECLEIYATSKQRRLRQEEVSFLLSAFHKKETIIDREDMEYALSKVYINSMYGVKVTTPIKSSYSIEEGEIAEIDYFKFNEEERKAIFNNFIETQPSFGGTLDIFTDGCYITSYARYELVETMCIIVNEGCNVVYSDTDSIKFYLNNVDEDYIINIINNQNWKITKGNKRNNRFKIFKEQFKISDNDFKKICKMGIWEIETVDENNNPLPIPYFITFGAKKYGYITHDNKVKTTIAGCNKKYPSIAINNLSKLENIPLIEAFKIVFAPGTQFDTSASGRTTAKIEKRTREEMQYYTYKGRRINQYGGIIIEDTTYTLNVSLNDSKILMVNRPNDFIISINIKGEIDFE
jgi:hypothetical protein